MNINVVLSLCLSKPEYEHLIELYFTLYNIYTFCQYLNITILSVIMIIGCMLMMFFELQSLPIILCFSVDGFEVLSLEWSDWLLICSGMHSATA
jgi:hypothetical protein